MFDQIAWKLLEQLIETPSPSGREAGVQKLWKAYISSFVTNIETDVHGNAVAFRKGAADMRVAIIGHSDEIGLMVTYITDEGYIRFDGTAPAGVDVLKGQHVVIQTHKGAVFGVIGADDLKEDEKEGQRDKNSAGEKISDLWIDIGAQNKTETRNVVTVGDPIVIEHKLKRLGTQHVVGQGLDGKIGIFVIAEVLRKLAGKTINPSIYACSTVQEEVTGAGAKIAAFKTNPHAAIVVDVTSATDYPTSKKDKLGDIRMGSGPIISVGVAINSVLSMLLKETAERIKTPFQIKAEPAYTETDADDFFITREGIATGILSIPMRYIHTPVEHVHLQDVENTILLLCEFLVNLRENQDFRPVI